MNITKEIFGSNDIRGLYEKELTNELAYLVGKAFGTICDGTVIVGHDARASSNALNTNLIKGLVEAGTRVIDIGLVTTPMLYYAREFFGKAYAIMVTAGHCTKEYNGFKLCDDEGSMYNEKIQNLLNLILSGDFKTGTGSVEPYDLTYDYKKLMLDKIFLGQKKLKVVVDCGNGTCSYFNPEIIKDWGVDVVPLHCENNPEFPNHTPDPVNEDNMYDLKQMVIKENADLGIAFDDDGDRIGIVDENGNLIKTDVFMLIIWKSIYRTCRNKTAVFDIKCSKILKEGVENLGLKAEFIPAGHSYFKKTVRQNNYDFAGEFSGHVYFNDDFYGYDDALYAAGRLLNILTHTNGKVSSFFSDAPKYVSTPEIHINVPEEKKDSIVNKVLNYAKVKGYEIVNIDGVRIEYPDGFALVKKSNTSPSIIVKFEGKTKESMEGHRLEIMKIINEEL